MVPFGGPEVLATYPELIRTAEVPVIDTACAALMELAKSVHAHGFKVALTGEGSDEFLAGYPWFKLHRVASLLDVIPGLELSQQRPGGRSCGLPGCRGSRGTSCTATRRPSAGTTPGWTSTA